MKKQLMQMPKFERQEKAGCVGCTALASINPSMVTFPCGVTVAGVAA